MLQQVFSQAEQTLHVQLSELCMGYFQESRVKAYQTVARHEDEFGLGQPITNFGATTPLNLSTLQRAFNIVYQPSTERALTPPDQISIGGPSENWPDCSGIGPEGPSNTLEGHYPEEDAIPESLFHPSSLELQACLPWNDGASFRGRRGREIGMTEDDLADATKGEVFRIIMDILTRKVLHNRPAADVTGELKN